MTSPGTRRRWPKVAGALLLVLVLLVAGAVFALDAILLSQARKRTDALSQQLGRPITVGGVKTKLLGGLGVRVTDVGVGAGPGEEVPLVTLRRAEVEADLWRAIRSGGKEIHVGSAVLEGLHVNVVKLPDGTTNAERFAKELEKLPSEETKPAPEQPAEAGAPPKLKVGRAAVENARIAFLDRTTAGAKELAIDDLDVEVRDLEAGKPLELVLRAAVLAEKQNLEVRVKAAPLPPTLEPTPEQLAVKLEPVDLAPLAPFFPKALGFRRGHLSMDLSAALGAAVPGGSGPTKLEGWIRAAQLFFSDARDTYLDLTFEADVEGDAAAGSLRIGKLVLVAGPVTVTGTGRVSGLKGETPRIEGLEVVAKGLDPEALIPYYPPLRAQLGGATVAGPIGLELRGGGTATTQEAVLRVDLTPVRLAVPEQLAKAAGAPASLVATVSAQGNGRVRFDAALDLAGVDLRPGGSLAKKPGDPLSVKAAGSYRAAGEAQELDVERLELAALADRLTGRANVKLEGTGAKATTRFDAELRGDRLDLDALLIPAPEPAPGAKPAPEEPLDPAAFRGLSGVAALRLGVLRMEKIETRNVVARIRVQEDKVTFEQARLEAFGGTIAADGTKAALADPTAPFEVVLDLKGLAGAQALALLSKHKVLDGKLDATVKLAGKGTGLEAIKQSLQGALSGNLYGGSFHGADLVGSIAGPLAAKLPFAAKRLDAGGATPLGKELPFAFRIEGGTARLEKPLTFDAAGQGDFSLDGGVGLDGVLSMPATFSLSPALVARITAGKVKPQAAIPVAFRLAGPAWKPRLEGLSLDGAVKAIASQAAAGALGRALGADGVSAEDLAAKKRAEVEAEAQKRRAEAEAKGREQAEKAKQKVEDEARKRLEGLFGK